MKKIEKNPDLMIPISKDNRLKELITEYRNWIVKDFEKPLDNPN